MPELNITVQRVAYPPQTGDPDAWYILITDHGTCKGRIPWRPHDKEQLTLDGEWTSYQGNREFSFKSARLNIPTSERDRLHYVCTRTTGLGPAMEQIIWERYGDRWQDVQGGEITRLSGRVYQEFKVQCEALSDKSEEVRTIAALMGKGCTANMAAAAFAKWEDQTLGVVNADCYRLAELEHYSFRDVDGSISTAYGITADDPRRIKAAVVYALRQLTNAGDTVVAWDEIYNRAMGMLGGYAELITECTRALFADGTLKGFECSGCVALAGDYAAEVAIWEFITTTTIGDN